MNTSRLPVLLWALGFSFASTESRAEEEAGSRPNIVFMLEADRIIANQTMDRPFFLYVAFNAVHGPLNEPPRYSDEYDVRDAMLKCLDDAVGRIVAAIEKHGFKDNTLIILTNDNGPVLEQMSKPYRGTKNTTFEGGVRVPCLVRWPGHTDPGSSNDGMMFIADWFPTFITLGGGVHEQELPIDGIDMTEMLFSGKLSRVSGNQARLPGHRHRRGPTQASKGRAPRPLTFSPDDSSGADVLVCPAIAGNCALWQVGKPAPRICE
jgi:hypothetical protein